MQTRNIECASAYREFDMQFLLTPPAVLEFLKQARELSELRDADGTVIGFFAPVAAENAAGYAHAASRFRPDQVQQLKDSASGTRPTQEVLERLGSVEQSS